MRISEISTPDLHHRSQDYHSQCPPTTTKSDGSDHLLSQLESLVKQTESITLSPTLSLPSSLPNLLRQTLTNLRNHTPLPNSTRLYLWKLSFRLWNSSVDISNASSLLQPASSSSATEFHANLRHVAADLLSLASPVSGVPSPELKTASFYYKTGLIFHDLRQFNLASTCFERASDVISNVDVAKISDSGEKKILLELNLARSRTAFEQSDKNLALTLLNRARVFLFGAPDHYNMIAKQYLSFGRSLLSKNETSSFSEALRLMNEGLDLCEKGINAAKTREQVAEMKELRSKALRFIAAVHLQRGEHESVIKCIKVLRDGSSGDDHPSLPVLAMKAWLGLGRYVEAEKELKGMVLNKGVPEGVWVSAVESYFDSAGVSGTETAKGVFLGLLGRCHVSASAAVRIAHRVVGDIGGEGGRVRAKVVAELVADDRVAALFIGEAVEKERTAMHAILWNCASDLFRLKDYEMSAEIFEKSLLYVPHDIQSRILRAKGYRVLCLCFLALSQLDRAQEYINEAEKLEPNIVCAFLKFKIYLQKNDCTAAINQIQAMKSCLDFTPDFLSLSAHEAVACCALTVAVASLSDLLNFYNSGKSMPITEVVVLRTLITILTQDPGHEAEALKFTKRAHSRSFELGKECFFGKGEVGIREQKWFAVTSWNLGTKCGKEKEYKLCAEFLLLASDFYGGLTDGKAVEETSILVCESLISTVSAMLASENQTKTPFLDYEVKQAVELLEKAGKILALISAEVQLGENKMISIDQDLFFNYTFICYNIQGRLDNTGPQQQLLLVKNFANSKACKPKHLLEIGICASQGPRSHPEVATFALNECLSALLSSPSPNYQDVALIVRRLIAVASVHQGDSDDDTVLNMYKQAYRIMVGLKEGEYPTEEGKWLATTAWNRAAVPLRLGQVDAGKKWMNVALELAGKVSGMETYKACMEDFAAGFNKKLQLQNNQNNW